MAVGRCGGMHRRSQTWIAAACFLVVFAALPPVVIAVSPGVDEDGFVCKVEVGSRLAETMQGKLEFFLVDVLQGESPAQQFVITIDHGYTAGIDVETQVAVDGAAGRAAVPGLPSTTFWLQGTLMDEDTYYGEQYLFFDYPQLYVSQVKSGPLWPTQVDRLRTLYASPLTAPVSIYLIAAFPFMEEYSPSVWGLIIARFALFCAAIAAATVYRRRRRRWSPGLVWVVGTYMVVTVGLTVPGL